MKYDWTPHEVRREQTEHIVAYTLVVLLVVSVPAAILLFMAFGMH